MENILSIMSHPREDWAELRGQRCQVERSAWAPPLPVHLSVVRTHQGRLHSHRADLPSLRIPPASHRDRGSLPQLWALMPRKLAVGHCGPREVIHGDASEGGVEGG